MWITPGSLMATLLWLAGSLAFRFYVVNFGSYNETYGAIGGVMVLMLWLYLTGLAVIIGAEMNAEIEHASPHGKDAGEKVRGQHRSIGAGAERAFRERQGKVGTASLRPAAPAMARQHAAGGRMGALAAGVIAAVFGRRIRG